MRLNARGAVTVEREESDGKVDLSCVSAELAKLRSTLRWQHASVALDRLREMGGETAAAEPPAETADEEAVEDWEQSFSQAVSSMQCAPTVTPRRRTVPTLRIRMRRVRRFRGRRRGAECEAGMMDGC
jgi:hypothetical protein